MSLTLRDKLYKYPRAFLRLVFIIVNNCYCIPTYVTWMIILLPLKKCQPDLYYRIEGLFFHWLLAVVSMWSWTAGYDIVELGDDITSCMNQRTLVIANHQSTADVPLMMTSFNAKKNILPNIMWIMDRLFKYTNFGIVSLIHQDFFISSGKSNRDDSIISLKHHLEKSYIPRQRNWMVLFPEGGFLRKRRDISNRFAEKNNLPILNNVTLPRVGAMKAIVDVLCTSPSSPSLIKSSSFGNENKIKMNGDGNIASSNNNTTTTTNNKTLLLNQNGGSGGDFNQKEQLTTKEKHSVEDIVTNVADVYHQEKSNNLEYILDVTIGYENGQPLDLPTIVSGIRDPCQTFFFYRLYHSSELPKENDNLTKWLYDRFIEKEEILDGFYKSGSFLYSSANTPTVVQQDPLRYIIIHLFFITSTYIHVQMFYMLLNYYNIYVLKNI